MKDNLAQVLEQVQETAAKRPQHKFEHKFYRKPYLDGAAINKTITINFHTAVKNYAGYCQERNHPVNLYNDIMKEREKEKKRNTPLLTLLFKRSCRERKIATTQVDDPEEYNKYVAAFNLEHGTHIKMKKWPPLKMGLDPVFSTMVKFYAAQLREFLRSKEADTANGIVILPQLRTNSWKIENYKVDGVPQVFLHKETIRRQIKRLDAAGIIQHFNRGADSDFGVYFNPEILDIKHRSNTQKADQKHKTKPENSRSQKTENQLSKGGKTTKCRVWDDSLPEHFEINQKEKQFATAQERNEPHGSTVKTRNLDQNTPSVPKPEMEPGAKNVKVLQLPDFLATAENGGLLYLDPPKNEASGANSRQAQNKTSAGLSQIIETDPLLAADLAGHKYDNYKPLDGKLLEWESTQGTLSDEEYIIIGAQDFAKDFARLYKQIDKHYTMEPWQWFNFLEYIQNSVFRTFTKRAMNKTTVFEKLMKMRRMLRRAVSSYSRKGNKNYPCFPSDYILRGHPVSFWNLEKRIEESDRQAAERKKKRAAKNPEFKKQAGTISKKRSERRMSNDHKKAMTAVRRYLRNEHEPGAYEKLFWYVKDNLLAHFSEGLGLLIEKERNAI